MATTKTPTLRRSKGVIEPAPDSVREFTSFQRSIYNRMLKCIKDKGLPKTQDLTRLAVSIFLDKEGF